MKTIQLLLTKAEANDSDAQNELGYEYDVGKQVQQDFKKAAYWYLKAAQNDHPNAQFNYAELCRDGVGVEKSLPEAIKWYAKSAALGYGKAAYCLGILYAKGEEVPQDLGSALVWLLLAEKLKCDGATQAREIVQKSISANKTPK